MMNIDFHIHAKLSKKVQFSLPYFHKMLQKASEAQLDAITLTEHFNTLHFEDIYDELDRHYPYQHHYYNVEGFKVFPGMEVDVAEGGHILMTGDREVIRKVRKQLSDYVQPGSFIPFDQLMDQTAAYDLLKVGAHPFRSSNSLQHLTTPQLLKLDAVDLNAKDLGEYGIQQMQQQMQSWAAQLGLPLLGGSDSHHPLQVGSIVNQLRRTCETIGELKQCIQAGDYTFVVSPLLLDKVKSAQEAKQQLQAELLRRIV